MRIAVLVKQVPDTWGDRRLDPSTGLLDRRAVERVIDEIGERAVEAALKVKDGDKETEVVIVTMGPAEAVESLRKALALGADSAIHIVHDDLAGSDYLTTAHVLADALRGRGFDLVIAGNESTDGRGGVVPSMVAELLAVPQLSALNSFEISRDNVSGERALEWGTMTVSAPLPALICVTERAPDARFAGFRGILGSKRKPVETLAPQSPVGSRSRSVVGSVTQRPARAAGVTVVDEGNGGRDLAAFLASKHLI